MLKVTDIGYSFKKEYLIEYFEQFPFWQKSYRGGYSEDYVLKVIDQVNFADYAFAKEKPVSFGFVKYLTDTYYYTYKKNIYKIKFKTKECALNVILEYKDRVQGNKHILRKLERQQLADFFKKNDLKKLDNIFLLNLAIYGFFLTPTELSNLLSKFINREEIEQKIHSGFFNSINYDLSHYPMFKDYDFKNHKQYMEECRKELSKIETFNWINYFCDESQNSYSVFERYDPYFENSPKLDVDILYERDKRFFTKREAHYYGNEKTDYPLTEMVQYLKDDDEKEKFLRDAISKINYKNWKDINIYEHMGSINSIFEEVFRHFDDTEKFVNILVDELFVNKERYDLGIDIFRYNDNFLYLMICFDSTLKKLEQSDVLHKILLKFKTVNYLFSKINPNHEYAQKRKNKKLCLGNFFDSGCDTCVHGIQKHMDAIKRCEKTYEPNYIEKEIEYNYDSSVKSKTFMKNE